VQPPQVGLLWTPGYWGFVGGVYRFNVGYWGPHVGYYGGVNYGFGYVGVGFAGGRWVGNSFAYNRAVVNVNINIHNTYNEAVVNRVSVSRVSYHGGPGGTTVVATAQERQWGSERHFPPTTMQREHVQDAARRPELSARANGGHPAIAATPRAGAFNAPGAVGARGASSPQHAGQVGRFGPNGVQRTPGQPGHPAQTNNFAHPPGQGAPRAQGQGQPGGAKPAKPARTQRPKPEDKKGEQK
jgi:hypothetical protein